MCVCVCVLERGRVIKNEKERPALIKMIYDLYVLIVEGYFFTFLNIAVKTDIKL